MHPFDHIAVTLAGVARPAQELEIGRITRSALRHGHDMVDLQPVGGPTGEALPILLDVERGNIISGRVPSVGLLLGSAVGAGSISNLLRSIGISKAPRFDSIPRLLRVLGTMGSLESTKEIAIFRNPLLARLPLLVIWVLCSPSLVLFAYLFGMLFAPLAGRYPLASLSLWAVLVTILCSLCLCRIVLRPLAGETVAVSSVSRIAGAPLGDVRSVLNAGAFRTITAADVSLRKMSKWTRNASEKSGLSLCLGLLTADNFGHPSHLHKGVYYHAN